MNNKVLLAALIFLSTSCNTFASDQSGNRLVAFCNLLSNNVNDDVETLLGKFGTPDEVIVGHFPNKHISDATDEVHTGIFKDGIVSVYSVPAIERNYLFRMEFTADFWPEFVPGFLNKSSKDVEDALGIPEKKDESSIRYSCDEEFADFIKFVFKSGQVVKLEAQRWMD